MPLTHKQQRFAEEFVKDGNAMQAYIRAGYKASSAQKNANRMKENKGISAEIERLTAEISAKAKLSAVESWLELRCLAKSNIADIIDFTGDVPRMKPANQIPDHALRAISSMKTKRYTEGHGENAREVEIIEFRLWDKPGQLIVALKANGELKEAVTLRGDPANPLQMQHKGKILILPDNGRANVIEPSVNGHSRISAETVVDSNN